MSKSNTTGYTPVERMVESPDELSELNESLMRELAKELCRAEKIDPDARAKSNAGPSLAEWQFKEVVARRIIRFLLLRNLALPQPPTPPKLSEAEADTVLEAIKSGLAKVRSEFAKSPADFQGECDDDDIIAFVHTAVINALRNKDTI